jgi:hypothetical protein
MSRPLLELKKGAILKSNCPVPIAMSRYLSLEVRELTVYI